MISPPRQIQIVIKFKEYIQHLWTVTKLHIHAVIGADEISNLREDIDTMIK